MSGGSGHMTHCETDNVPGNVPAQELLCTACNTIVVELIISIYIIMIPKYGHDAQIW